jgi:superfamily II DNA or RNA helicase
LSFQLRPYQIATQQAIVDARTAGVRRQVISMATGTGKTVVLATLPRLLNMGPNDVMLVVAHRDELIEQICDKLFAANPDLKIGVEKAERSAPPESNIVVATVQTLTRTRLAKFVERFRRRISLFVIDEAHHTAAPTYRAIFDAILAQRSNATILGFTATPQRGDGVKIVDGVLFEKIVYEMDARRSIAEGYLVPVRSFRVATKTDLSEVATRGGDFVLGQLADAVDNPERNAQIYDAYRRFTPDSKALVFAASVAHAGNLCAVFKKAGVRAAWASGDTPTLERERIVADFRGTKIQVLVNCNLYLEGFDVPSIEVILNARPTQSTTLYTQITGRGLRPPDPIADQLSAEANPDRRRVWIAASEKPHVIVLDVIDVSQREVISLPMLWGLPGQIDAQGRFVSIVADMYDELVAKDPHTAARVRTADQIEAALANIAPTNGHHKKATNGVWQQVGFENWRLEVVNRVARDRRGRTIPLFGEHFNKFVENARRMRPDINPELQFLKMRNADPRTISEEFLRYDIELRENDYVTMLSSGNAAPREIATAPSLPLAMTEVAKRLEAGEPFGPNGATSRHRGRPRRPRRRRR